MTPDVLRYPFDVALLARRRRGLRDELLANGRFTDIKVAILGGSTTSDVQDFLELFLLAAGIRPTFYVSDYNQFYEAAVVDGDALRAFAPDVVYVHTTHRNIVTWPELLAGDAEVEAALAAECGRFEAVWAALLGGTDCLLIQNNFDPLPLDPLGHLGASAAFGRSRFVARLNASFADFARRTPRMRLNDIHLLAAQVGLGAWASARHWFHYRMALAPEGSAHAAHAAARIIRAAFGKSRKCLVLDLDDTLWGGIVGDEGVDALRLGHETPEGEAFVAFQRYCLALKQRGILLAVCSKNDAATARAGFTHPDSVLTVDDFSVFVANWEPKPDNLRAIAGALGIGLDALVFVDDNPAEQALVRREVPEVAVPAATHVTAFAEVLDREGYFDPFSLGADDLQRAATYQQNVARASVAVRAGDFGAYLDSLEMVAEIRPFAPAYIDRITQLVNKTNQFNLTTRRYTQAQIERIAAHPDYVTLYGKLRDRFGDNGLVSVVIGERRGSELHIETWLMSCRVLKRSLELAMFDELVKAALRQGIETLVGYYTPTPRNGMVQGHYQALGFERSPCGVEGAPVWQLDLRHARAPANTHIKSGGPPNGIHHSETASPVS
jgi:FkbH-like protein